MHSWFSSIFGGLPFLFGLGSIRCNFYLCPIDQKQCTSEISLRPVNYDITIPWELSWVQKPKNVDYASLLSYFWHLSQDCLAVTSWQGADSALDINSRHLAHLKTYQFIHFSYFQLLYLTHSYKMSAQLFKLWWIPVPDSESSFVLYGSCYENGLIKSIADICVF